MKSDAKVIEFLNKALANEWMKHQTMLINEKQLNMMDMGARTYLAEQRDKFFNNEDYEQAEGYVPPSE